MSSCFDDRRVRRGTSNCFPLNRLTFVFNPSSRVYGYESFELKPGGEHEVCPVYVCIVYLRSF